MENRQLKSFKDLIVWQKAVDLNFIFFFISLYSIFYILYPFSAEAARLYFEPQEQVIGTEGVFSVVVNIDAEEPINAVSAAISVSDNLIPIDINEANSIINFWVDKPNWDETKRLLTFSGITPGGFEGRDGYLLVLKLETRDKEQGARDKEQGARDKEQGTEIATLSFDKKNTKVYLHTADGIEDSLMFEDIKLPIVRGKQNIGVEKPDYEPPEQFTPEIAQDPNIFFGKRILVFATQDKGSGMHHYEVLEKREYRIENLEFRERPKSYILNSKSWVRAESPYVLKDQKLRSYIYVKAVDKAGNERIAVVAPRYLAKWYASPLWWVIIILAIIIATVLFWIWKKNKKLKSRY